MPYDPKVGWSTTTIDAITTHLMNSLNSEFGFDYTLETFKGTMWWRVLQPSIIQAYTSEANRSLLMDLIVSEVGKITGEIELNSSGLVQGIKKALMDISFITNVGFGLPSNPEIGAGKIGIGIEYVEGVDEIEIENQKQEIANAIVQNGTGAGILTFQKEGFISKEGLLTNNQPFLVSWGKIQPKKIYLKMTYDIRQGGLIPAEIELKKILKDTIAESYFIGGYFNPYIIATSSNFSFFAFSKLEYSFDGNSYSVNKILTEYLEKWTFADEDIVFVSGASFLENKQQEEK